MSCSKRGDDAVLPHATVNGAEPDYVMIRNVAAECRMPLCYGGGIRTVAQAVRIIKMGVEKVANEKVKRGLYP